MEDIEDSEFVASEHDRLVSAISKLDKTQHITDPTRSEPTNLNSEFNLIKRSNRLNLDNVAKILSDTAKHVQIGKKLRKTSNKSNILPKPLEKPQVERIKRSTGYGETKKKVGRWDPVVARSRTMDFVSFPLKQEIHKLQPTNEFLSKFELKSKLEKELEELDPPPVEILPEDDEEKVYPMSYEEMLDHRQHLAKLRAKESYKAAKAKRQSKIKSKKYHRILKKERLKQQLKEFEDLQEKNPEEALKKLDALEKSRALERHTLRHKNTGKWAKSKLIRAKYDKETRQQLAEQLAVSRSLTHKTQEQESSDDEVADEGAIADLSLSQDPMNPWMLNKGDKSNVDAEFDFGYKKYLKERQLKLKAEEDSDEDAENPDKADDDETHTDLSTLKAGVNKLLQNNNVKNNLQNEEKTVTKISEEEESVKVSNTKEMTVKSFKAKRTKGEKAKPKIKKIVATSNWVVESVEPKSKKSDIQQQEDLSTAFDSLESKVATRVDKKLNKLRHHIERLEKITNSKERKRKYVNDEINNIEYLQFKNKNMKPIIDEELIEGNQSTPETTNVDSIEKLKKTVLNANNTVTTDSNIDANKFIGVKPKYLNSILPQGENDFDQLDDDEQVVPKVNIEEVFEEDDVVASFRQEKEDEMNKDKPEVIDLSLPGWGSWGGKGVKAPKRRRNRFIFKPAPITFRRDENKGDIIIKEYKDPKLTVHKVNEIPFPFTSVKDYEASIRAPIGNTFIPEKAHKKLIRPSVITKAGTVIDPMDEDELLIKRNRNFLNESVIKVFQKNKK